MSAELATVPVECYATVMPGAVKARGSCPCGGKWEFVSDRHGYRCKRGCPRLPNRYMLRFYWYAAHRQVRLFADRHGQALASWGQAMRVNEDVTADLKLGKFDERDYRARSRRDRLFTTFGDALIASMQAEADAGERNGAWVQNFRSYYVRHVRPAFDRTEIEDVKPLRIREWLEGLKMTVPNRRTWLHCRAALKAVLKFAVDNEALTHVPQIPKVLPPTGRRTGDEWLTRDEQSAVLSHLEAGERPIFDLMAGAGLRPSEATRLDLDAVSVTDEVTLTIRRSKTGPRSIVLDDLTGVRLRSYLAGRGISALHGGRGVPLFTRPGGWRWRTNRLTTRWAVAMDIAVSAAEVPAEKRCRLNRGCRHSWVNQRISEGYDQQAVASYAGHSPEIENAAYYHGAPRRLSVSVTGR